LPPAPPCTLSPSLAAARLIHRAAKRGFLPVFGKVRGFGEGELFPPGFMVAAAAALHGDCCSQLRTSDERREEQ